MLAELPFGVARSYPLECPSSGADVNQQLSCLIEAMSSILTQELTDHHYVSCYFTMVPYMIQSSTGEESPNFAITTLRMFVQSSEDVDEAVRTMLAQALDRLEKVEQRGSGWIYQYMKEAKLHVASYRPFTGSTYFPLPPKLRNKKACINVKNQDQKCFIWAILSALHPAKNNVSLLSNYRPFEAEINMEGMPLPMPLDKNLLSKFLHQNPSLKLNVFIYEDNEVLPFFQDPSDPQTAINLLFLPGNHVGGHYVWIKNFERIVFDVTKDKMKKFICLKCFGIFISEKARQRHLPDCELLTSQDGMKMEFPKCPSCESHDTSCSKCRMAAVVSFKDYKAQLPIPCVMVCDFESYLTPIEEEEEEELPTKRSFTTFLKKHEPLSYAILVVIHPKYQHLPLFQDYVNMMIMKSNHEADPAQLVQDFLSNALQLGKTMRDMIQSSNVPMVFRPEDKARFEEATVCGICGKELHSSLPHQKVRHHDHLTGEFICAAHQDCNINCNYANLKIPVIFHNLRGYDSKHLMMGFSRLPVSIRQNLDVLAVNSEQFKTIRLGPIQFLDSFQHLSSSLDGLVKTMLADCWNGDVLNIDKARTKFVHLNDEYRYLPNSIFALLLRKGVFPYSWIDEPSKLFHLSLPSKEAFFNDLDQEHISDADYAHAQKVWKAFNMTTFQDYHDLYLKTDVLLLADVLAGYRSVSMNTFGMDPLWFITAPSLTYQALLKKTGVSLDLITDMEMYQFVMKGVRGGLSFICKRKSEANVPQMPGYDPTQPTKHIIYMDANNLYG